MPKEIPIAAHLRWVYVKAVRAAYLHVGITQVFATAEAFSSRTLAELRFPPARLLGKPYRFTFNRENR